VSCAKGIAFPSSIFLPKPSFVIFLVLQQRSRSLEF
jgi:hypothetical protein